MIVRRVGSTDRQLLDDFVHAQDPVAFQNLVSRHGAAVHQVCRGVLGDLHEAEDAFQATFLVLARKAPVIREPDSLGGWLRGVAYRVAVRARRRSVRRRETEKLRAEMSQVHTSGSVPGDSVELRELVGNELDRLPDDYRQPLILCYLDGLTHQEAARRLGWPVGTVKVRLVRGRRLLRDRLHRRGIALGAGLLALLPWGRRAHSATEPLVESTVRAVSLDAAGRHHALESEFPRILNLANSQSRPGPGPGSAWLWAGLAIVGFSMLLSVPLARAYNGPPSPEVERLGAAGQSDRRLERRVSLSESPDRVILRCGQRLRLGTIARAFRVGLARGWARALHSWIEHAPEPMRRTPPDA